MTGFARSETTTDGQLLWRSVRSITPWIQLKLPEAFRALDRRSGSG